MDCAVKKNPGRLNLSLAHISWQSNDGSARETIKLADVKGMQATPPTAAKMRIKLTKNDGQALMLEFGSSAELEKAKNALQTAIKNFRAPQKAAANGETAAPATNAPPAAAAAANAPPTSSATTEQTAGAKSSAAATAKPASDAPKPKRRVISLDPAKLLRNLDLQRSILRQDPDLMKTFQQTVVSSGALTNEQFWSLRIHLLVTAAQQQLQTRGSYNVLSTIKPTTGSDNKVNINLTREKISDMFDQYPLVRKAYNDNVPKLSEGEFWQRFFMSRLFLVLRGEKVSQTHSTDAVLDPYIDLLNELQAKRAKKIDEGTLDEAHGISTFYNVEANANNNPETYGNNLMTTAGGGTKSLIRSVNSLSQRLLLGKRKREPTTAAATEAEAVEELRLQDLEPEKGFDGGVELHVGDLKATAGGAADGENVQSNKEALEGINISFKASLPKSIDLSTVGNDVNGLSKALEEIVRLTPSEGDFNSSETVVDSNVQLVNATTVEFLKQFWHARLSNQPEQANSLRGYLEKSLERIGAVRSPQLGSLVDAVQCALKST